MNQKNTPISIVLKKAARILEIEFSDNTHFELSCEYMRVFSPSADVQGHTADQAVLQLNKEDVNIVRLDPVGNYAIRPHFDDGHNTGIYSWEYLYQLGLNKEKNWQSYLDRLAHHDAAKPNGSL